MGTSSGRGTRADLWCVDHLRPPRGGSVELDEDHLTEGEQAGQACEHAFVTSQRHAYSRFRRALLTKNANLIYAAATELQHVDLEDVLRILVVLAEKRDDRFERGAARFAARVTTERRLDLAESRYVLALAEALPRSPDAVALLLRSYCDR